MRAVERKHIYPPICACQEYDAVSALLFAFEAEAYATQRFGIQRSLNPLLPNLAPVLQKEIAFPVLQSRNDADEARQPP